MRPHPIHGSDDTACRWLCLSAGRRTRQDEAEILKALDRLPFRGRPFPPADFPSLNLEIVK